MIMIKKIIYLFLSCIPFLSAQAMERPDAWQDKDNRKFYVSNEFPAPMSILYVLKDSKKAKAITLVPGELKEVPEWTNMNNLYIAPSSFWKDQSIAQIVDDSTDYYLPMLIRTNCLRNSTPGRDITLVLSAKPQETKRYLQLSHAKEPFNLTYKAMAKKAASVPKGRRLIDALPRVEEALELGNEVMPHHVLAVAPQASMKDIIRAHKDLLEVWEPNTRSNDLATAEFARNLLHLVNLAYESMQTGNNVLFKNLINRDSLIRHYPQETITP